MPLMSGVEMLQRARRDGYAVGGFDIFDLESVRAVVAAAEEEKSPVFLQACVQSVAHLGFDRAGAIMCDEARRASVPVAVHFDHGAEITCLPDVAGALDAGFTSVMVDGSRLPLAENIALTRKASEMAHEVGAGAEGEIGQIGRVTGGKADDVARQMTRDDDPRNWRTSPEEAAYLVRETGVDYLAVSIGSVSGTSSRLDLPLLKELASLLTIPLVLHGGTGVPEDDMHQAIKMGIAKVNIAHGVRRAYMTAIRESFTSQNTDNPFILANAARQAMQAYVTSKIRLLRGD